MIEHILVFLSVTALLTADMIPISLQTPKVDLSQFPQNTSEVSQEPLPVKGHIPSWLNGKLVRTGPGILKGKDDYVAHWFDGLAKLEAFAIKNGQVLYSCRFLQSGAYRTYKQTGKFDFYGFAQKPSSFQFSFVDFFLDSKNENIHNANVTMAQINRKFVAFTETPLPVEFDKNLNTVGYFDYDDNLPKNHSVESAHVLKDPITKETWNFLINIGTLNSSYRIYRILDNSSERKLLVTIPTLSISYMHSFSLAGNYIVLIDYPLRCDNPKQLSNQFIESFTWQPKERTLCYVIDRRTGEYSSYEIDPLFSFHHVNGFERDNKIYVDFIAYPNADIIWGVNKFLASKNEHPNKLMRLEINPQDQTTKLTPLFTQSIEFPRINDAAIAQNYQYFYAVHFNNGGSGLMKFDHHTSKHLYWAEENCYANEPIFVAKPHSSLEDDGVILSVINNLKTRESFLLILDARDFQELARVKAPHLIPFGFHGMFFQ